MDQSLPRTLEILQRGIDQKLHLGAQLYVSLYGEVIADLGIGESRVGVPYTRDSISWWLSCSKPLTAVAVAQLWEQNKLRLDDRVAQHIPEFAAGGKEAITLRHVLTHTGGFRSVGANWSPDPWDQIIARICSAAIEPGWVPGERAGYHVASGWFILGEIVRRMTGMMIDRYVRQFIFEPLGMRDSWLGMPSEKYAEYGDRIVTTYPTEKGPPPPDHPPPTAELVSLVRPGGNGRGPVRELGRFYESLLSAFVPMERTRRILSDQTADTMIARHRVGMYDHTFAHVLDWGLGFIINSNQYGAETAPYGYGLHASPRTFGHSGWQTSSAFCDPGHGLVVAWVCNGSPGEARHQVRQRALNTAIYEDLRSFMTDTQ